LTGGLFRFNGRMDTKALSVATGRMLENAVWHRHSERSEESLHLVSMKYRDASLSMTIWLFQ
jgi:hypothetical protein